MAPKRVIERYKSLADSERGFKDVESELKIDPVHHRLPERVRAHASICFMALILRKGAPRRSVWKLTVRIHNSSRARWGLWGTRYSELSTNPRGGV